MLKAKVHAENYHPFRKLWFLVFGLWSLAFGLWPLVFGLGTWDFVIIKRRPKTQDQRPKTGVFAEVACKDLLIIDNQIRVQRKAELF